MKFRLLSFLKPLAGCMRGGPVWRGGNGDIVLVLGGDGLIADISASADEIIGEGGGLKGRSLYDFVRREDRPAVRAALARARDGGPCEARDLRAEFGLLRRRRAPARAEISFMAAKQGKVRALIRDRGGEFARVREARAAAESLQGFLPAQAEQMADLGHELKTPLNAIMGFAEAMQAELYGPLGDDKYKEYAGLIHSSGAHLLDLISSILDRARMEAGRYTLAPALIAPAPVARESAEMIRGETEKAGLTLTVNIAPGLPEAMLDVRAVKQILINLLSNAVKFTAEGEIELSVSESCGALDFIVRDTGIGMNQIALAKLGGRYTDVHQNGVRGAEGTGLGLSLAFSLAKLHGGVLKLDSAPGEGTTARLTLPLRKGLSPFEPLASGAGSAGDIKSQLDRVAQFRRERAREASAA